MKLIFDTVEEFPEVTIEETLDESTGETTKKYKIKGPYSTIGEMNRNGRKYPMALWEAEVAKYQANFASGSINTLMEYEHPARTSVDPMEAVAKITSLKIEGKFVMGESVLLDNPKANQLKTLIDNDIKISVSSRGVGSVKNGIVESFKLVTYDIVAAPSDFNASMNGLVESYQLNEGVIEALSFTINEFGNIVPLVENADESDVYDEGVVIEAVKESFTKLLKGMS